MAQEWVEVLAGIYIHSGHTIAARLEGKTTPCELRYLFRRLLSSLYCPNPKNAGPRVYVSSSFLLFLFLYTSSFFLFSQSRAQQKLPTPLLIGRPSVLSQNDNREKKRNDENPLLGLSVTTVDLGGASNSYQGSSLELSSNHLWRLFTLLLRL